MYLVDQVSLIPSISCNLCFMILGFELSCFKDAGVLLPNAGCLDEQFLM